MKLPTLYHQSTSGKIYSWDCRTEDNLLCVEYGTMDGKKNLLKKETEGKNIGKANETSPSEQAEKEAQALWKNRIDRKYSKTIEEAKKTVFLPMLAHDFWKEKKEIKYPVFVQPKLNGVRCLAFWEDDEVVLMSRQGKQYNLPHIKEELRTFLPKNAVFDGEIYIHGISLQNINRLVKKWRPEESPALEYHVYDFFNPDEMDKTYLYRFNQYRSRAVFDGVKSARCFFHSTFTVESQEELMSTLSDFEECGYEGLIIRKMDALYKLGHRSHDLLKVKNFKDDEFKIVGATEANGADKGTVVWVCETKDGKEFGVRPMGTREQRKEWFDNREQFYGKKLTVKYQELSDDDVPIFPVGVAIRLEEDLP